MLITEPVEPFGSTLYFFGRVSHSFGCRRSSQSVEPDAELSVAGMTVWPAGSIPVGTRNNFVQH